MILVPIHATMHRMRLGNENLDTRTENEVERRVAEYFQHPDFRSGQVTFSNMYKETETDYKL